MCYKPNGINSIFLFIKYIVTRYMKSLIILLFIITSIASFAVVPTFKHYGINQGLPTSSVKVITQDKVGYLWVGTTSGLYRFDGYEFIKIDIISTRKGLFITSLFFDYEDTLWVGTNKNGLFRLKNNIWSEVKGIDELKRHIKAAIPTISQGLNNDIWVGTTKGLSYFSNNNQQHSIESFNGKYIGSLKLIKSNHLVIGSKGEFYVYNLKTKDIRNYPFVTHINAYVHDILFYQDILWLATSKGLMKFDLKKEKFLEAPNKIQNTRVLNISENRGNIWIATIDKGLFNIDKSGNITNFSNAKFENSLSDKYINTVYISKSHDLWVGNFYNGLNHLDLDSLGFKYETAIEDSLYCTNSSVINNILLKSKTIVWLSNSNGLIKFNKTTKKCSLINYISKDNTGGYTVYSAMENGNSIWLSTSQGVKLYDDDSKKVTDLGFRGVVFFTYKHKDGSIYIGSDSGLYKYSKGKLHLVTHSEGIISSYTVDNNNTIYLLTSKGLAYIDNNEFKEYNFINDQIKSKEITSIYVNKKNELYLGVKHVGLMHFDQAGNLIRLYEINNNIIENFTINSILSELNENILWLGSDKGLIKFDLTNEKVAVFLNAAGTYNNYYLPNSAFQYQNGEMYFGSTNGFIYFHPKDINTNFTPPSIVISKMALLNKGVEIGKQYSSGFSIDKPINQLSKIELGYKDYIIGFEFAALDFSDSMRNQYGYRLRGLNDDWVYVDANDRKVTYTNLKPGDYTFQVKAANKDGVWSKKPKELKIKVYPAPWFSPWAYFAYLLVTIFAIWSFIRYKTIASRKRAQQLEVTVTARTQEVKLQKKMVESLLEHKNEVFANVTHEFKTPLALILGPIEQLMNKTEYVKDFEALNMVQRNAKRLILMVGQILKLSQAEFDKEVIRESQALKPILTMLYESFKPLAADKNIQLSLDNKHDVNVYATSECLETVVGNIISNALKFTSTGGEIYIGSELKDQQISISVRDTGTGIDKKDQDKIFKRFIRLDTHKSIQGTGIGLSVVKEITEANDGQVMVRSEWGKGSEFRVIFPVSDISANEEMSQVMVDQLVSNTGNEFLAEKNKIDTKLQCTKNRITVLIVEDNLDMQTHIGNVLKERFNCLFADRGRLGIAIALKEVPDIVICDVMMPGMDGYQVTRILRHDERTSHIPIILLTALNSKESRIKGWRENIDVYVTKPFDATELNVQLDNILTIRKILQKTTNKAIKSNSPLTALDLSKKDLKFIEKFKNIIGDVYDNEYFQKADLAVKMAVSERQLQRKVKALIGENPMDMLRDYRLEKAAIKLKDGYQVSLVGEECGFSSVSYFGKCFKKKYGVTPKQYQQMKKP